MLASRIARRTYFGHKTKRNSNNNNSNNNNNCNNNNNNDNNDNKNNNNNTNNYNNNNNETLKMIGSRPHRKKPSLYSYLFLFSMLFVVIKPIIFPGKTQGRKTRWKKTKLRHQMKKRRRNIGSSWRHRQNAGGQGYFKQKLYNY